MRGSESTIEREGRYYCQCLFNDLLFQAWVGNKEPNTQYYSVSKSVQLRGLLLRGECLQDLPSHQGQQGGRPGGALQGLGRVCQQQEEGGASVEAEGGQGRGEARHLGLPRCPHLQTGSQV